jgi:hexosaminidase
MTTDHHVVPAPVHVDARPGRHVIGPDTRLECHLDDASASSAERVLRFLPFSLRGDGQRSRITLRCDPALGPGASRLDVDTSAVHVVAGDHEGLVRALHVLRQLLPDDAFRLRPTTAVEWALPCCHVEDRPALGWRGLLLDVARHFMPVRDVLRYVDLMAVHGLNRLQLHLTDDQGWRLESHRYPRLHEVGSHRTRSQRSHFHEPPSYDDTPHGGYYTRGDIREIVDHATDRGIVVVPEIELPGHAGALAAAYPEHAVPRGIDHDVLGTWGINHVLTSPLPDTADFLAGVLDEVCDMFPSPWIHVGADESRLDVWEADRDVAAYVARTAGGDIRRAFAHFVAGLATTLATRSRTMVTWDDAFAATGGAPDGTVVVAWRGLEVAQRAAASGHPVVLAPVMPLYFDYFQDVDVREPLAIGGPVTLDDVLAFDPSPPDWSDAELDQRLGVQAQLWTEWVPDTRAADYLLFPRLCAFAEVAWRGAPVDPEPWRTALERHLGRLRAAGVEYRPFGGPQPWQEGGTGWRRSRQLESMASKLAKLDVAARHGDIAFGDELDRT